MRQFGGAPQCPRCSKSVYAAEQITGPGGMWHKACMTCKECNKRLDSTNLTEKDREIINVDSCYGKLYGPKGYGYGGGAGVLSTDSSITVVEKIASPFGSTSDLATGTVSSSQSSLHAEERAKINSTAATVGGVCPRCSKQVYFAEQMLGPGGVKYHKLCFRCSECNKGLDSTTLAEKDNVLYCKGCHSKAFGPKGYGYAAGASFMHTEGVSR